MMLSYIVLPVKSRMSPVCAFCISSWLEMRHTFQKLGGANSCAGAATYYNSDAGTISALFICKFIIVTQVASEALDCVIKVKVLSDPFLTLTDS